MGAANGVAADGGVTAAVIASLYGAQGVEKLLVGSQVVLSIHLPFAVIPLILITSDRRLMGDLVNTRAAGDLLDDRRVAARAKRILLLMLTQ